MSQEGYVTALSLGETLIEAVHRKLDDKAVCRVVVTESDKMLLYEIDESLNSPMILLSRILVRTERRGFPWSRILN